MGIAVVAQFGAERLQPVGIAVHQRNPRARGKHGPGARQPDAGGGAGNRRDLSGELHSAHFYALRLADSLKRGRGKRASGERESRR